VETITLAQAQRAIQAVLDVAESRGYCVAIAVADASGDFVATARMDGSYRRWVRNAGRKAYTSAIMGRDTQALYEELRRRERTLLEYGEPRFTTLPGGLAVYDGRRCIGGIGVTGAAAGHDEDLARIGLETMGFVAEVDGRGDTQALFGH
jgi:glc operon protein GlcG